MINPNPSPIGTTRFGLLSNGVRVPYERTIALLKWKSVGEVLIPGVLNVGDIYKTDGYKKAEKLAEMF